MRAYGRIMVMGVSHVPMVTAPIIWNHICAIPMTPLMIKKSLFTLQLFWRTWLVITQTNIYVTRKSRKKQRRYQVLHKGLHHTGWYFSPHHHPIYPLGCIYSHKGVQVVYINIQYVWIQCDTYYQVCESVKEYMLHTNLITTTKLSGVYKKGHK